jgi:hypothetical protein
VDALQGISSSGFGRLEMRPGERRRALCNPRSAALRYEVVRHKNYRRLAQRFDGSAGELEAAVNDMANPAVGSLPLSGHVLS